MTAAIAEVKKPNGSEALVPISSAPAELLMIALQNNAAIDVIERLAALQEKAIASDAEMQFNDALNRAQEKISRIAPDLDNPQTKSKYASYAALDRVIRPVYILEGFSLSFDTDDCPKDDCVRVLCYVSRGRHTRKYKVDIASDGKGAKGGDVMTKTHATGAAMSYGMRYLLKFIFNVAVGEGDTDGNLEPSGELMERIEFLQNASTIAELRAMFKNYYVEFASNPPAQRRIVHAYEAKKRELL